jgi:hypothetical protein
MGQRCRLKACPKVRSPTRRRFTAATLSTSGGGMEARCSQLQHPGLHRLFRPEAAVFILEDQLEILQLIDGKT